VQRGSFTYCADKKGGNVHKKPHPPQDVDGCLAVCCTERNFFRRVVSVCTGSWRLSAPPNRLYAPGLGYGRTRRDAGSPTRCFAVHTQPVAAPYYKIRQCIRLYFQVGQMYSPERGAKIAKGVCEGHRSPFPTGSLRAMPCPQKICQKSTLKSRIFCIFW